MCVVSFQLLCFEESYSRLPNNCRVWNNHIGWTFPIKLINVGYGIVILGGKFTLKITSNLYFRPKCAQKMLKFDLKIIKIFFIKSKGQGLINVWYGIRACWVENLGKINKHTPTLIRQSKVSQVHYLPYKNSGSLSFHSLQ